MTYASVCSGVEAFGKDWEAMGYESVFHAEIEPHASAVLRYHYPTVPNYGDFTQIATESGSAPTRPVRLLCGGTPCFAAGTTIVTSTGIRPIEQVRVGDLVLTHALRWKPVLQIGSKNAETAILKGHGHSGIETTAEHPFYAQNKVPVWNNVRRAYERCLVGEPKWVEAQYMESLFWATPTKAELIAVPPIVLAGNETHLPAINSDLYWVMGAWLGDGWTRIKPRRSYVVICGDKNNHLEIGERLTRCGLNFSTNFERTTIRYQIASSALAKYLLEHFGSGAKEKTMPAWAIYGLDEKCRSAFFEGYQFADGFVLKCNKGKANGVGFTTISPCLATGVRLLGASLGYSVGETLCAPNRELFIEGRKVNEQPFYSIRCNSNTRTSITEHGILWQKVKRYTDTRTVRPVFNLEVAEDNSYVAGGIIVHNCQSFSVAGLREGLVSAKGNLALEFILLAKRLGSQWVLWENVPGVLSSVSHESPAAHPPKIDLDGEDGPADGEEVVVEDEYDADENHAFNSFLAGLSELGYGVAYRTLDAQYFGIGQRRRRVFVVGCLGGWQAASAVLFDPEGLQGNTPQNGLRAYPTLDCGTIGRKWQSNQWCRNGFAIRDAFGIRRATPVECERFQGWPDEWTSNGVDESGNKYMLPDYARYERIGNGWATPPVTWLGQRIKHIDTILQTTLLHD